MRLDHRDVSNCKYCLKWCCGPKNFRKWCCKDNSTENIFNKGKKLLQTDLNAVKLLQKVRCADAVISNMKHISKLKRKLNLIEL